MIATRQPLSANHLFKDTEMQILGDTTQAQNVPPKGLHCLRNGLISTQCGVSS